LKELGDYRSLMLQKLSTINLKKSFKDEEVKFRLATSLKVTLIPVITFFVLFGVIWLFLKMNLVYFVTRGYDGGVSLSEVYYEYILSTLLGYIPFFIGFIFFLLIAGLYISEMIIRPFKLIGDYAERILEGQEAIYDPEFFVDLKLLTRFSEYFFNILENAKKNGNFSPIEIPKKFQKVHQPVFEGSFFLQFFVLIFITCFFVAIIINLTIIDIYEGLIKLSTEVLTADSQMSYFFSQQYDILELVTIAIFVLYLFLYLSLSWHLYQKVSAPAFGIFATMRSFLKGNYDARVHLLGFYYIRPQSRKFNKYLDLMAKELDLKKSTK